jgi:hypothetical protein
MKLRIAGNSVRFRLKRSDLSRLLDTGRVSESTCLGNAATLTYRLRLDPLAAETGWSIVGQVIEAVIPESVARSWASANEVGLYADRVVDGKTISLVIEKDFACRHEAGTCAEADSFAEASLRG